MFPQSQTVTQDFPLSWKELLAPALFNPFTPKFKKYILPTLEQKVYKWGSENW